MKDKTTMRNINGSAYLLVSPAFRRHIGINNKEFKERQSWEIEIQDENKTKGPFISFWKPKTN